MCISSEHENLSDLKGKGYLYPFAVHYNFTSSLLDKSKYLHLAIFTTLNHLILVNIIILVTVVCGGDILSFHFLKH